MHNNEIALILIFNVFDDKRNENVLNGAYSYERHSIGHTQSDLK
jgi:hypothetical protein